MEKPQEESRPRGFSFFEAGISFRRMDSPDLNEIMEIERASFSYPWSAQFFLQELKVPCARSLLAVRGGKTIGYVVYWFLPHEIDIHNLAVHPGYRRRGIGTALLREVIEEARRQRLIRVTLEVRKSNEAAQKLYRSLGFVAQRVRKGYYSDNGEDALAMALELQG